MTERLELVSQLAHYRSEWRALKLRPEDARIRALITHVRFWRTKLEISMDAVQGQRGEAPVDRELAWREELLAEFNELLSDMSSVLRGGEAELRPPQTPAPRPFPTPRPEPREDDEG